MKTKIRVLGVSEFDDKPNFVIEIDGELYRTDLCNIWVPNTRGLLSCDTPLAEGIEIETEIRKYEPEYNGNIFSFVDLSINVLSLIAGDLIELRKNTRVQIAANIEAVLKDAQEYRKSMQEAQTESEWREVVNEINARLIEKTSPFLVEAKKKKLLWECIDDFCTKKYGIRCYKTFSGYSDKEEHITLTFPYQIVNLEEEIAHQLKHKRILATYELGKFYVSQAPRGGENGKDGYYKFDVIDKTDGKTYIFVWRDVFDFGTWGFPFRDGIDPFKEETWSEKEREIYQFVRRQFSGGVRM